MSSSIVITGTKEFIKNSGDMVKTTTDTLEQAVSDNININDTFDFTTLMKYLIFFGIILLITYFVLYNNGITPDYIIKYFVYGTGETIKQTVETSVNGVKTTLNATEKSIDNAVNIIEESVGIDTTIADDTDSDSINRKLLKKRIKRIPQPDDTTNNIKKKAGYCYIGEDRGFRSCVKVSHHDVCMSGDIFPTRDICINPNLRN